MYDRLLQNHHHWTADQLYGENTPDVVDQLRWTHFVDLMSEIATLDIESKVEDLDQSDQLRKTTHQKAREALEARFRGKERLRLADALKLRAATRLVLLLPEVPPRG